MECAGDVLRDWDLLTYSCDSFYPDWDQHPEVTRFIPESLDIQGYETGGESKDNITEYLAQSNLFSALQNANKIRQLGGIFVARFDLNKISRRIKALEKDLRREQLLLGEWRTWFTKMGANRAEDNILLLHPQLGIILLAVNPACIDSKQFQERDNIAKKTAEDTQRVLSDLFCILTNSQRCDTEIGAIVCLPEANGEAPNHIYKAHIDDIDQMAAFWTDRIEESIAIHGVRNYYNDSAFVSPFRKFARFIVSYRSSVTISARNAHEVYRHREMRTVSAEEEGGNSVFCLNPRQLSSYLAVNRHQVFFGLPGTGKTLLLMLLATKATLEERNGRVYVVTGGTRLIRKYNKSFEDIKNQTHRKGGLPIVTRKIKLSDISDEDDFFTDEMQSISGNWQSFLQKRAQLKEVYTVIAVSGRAWATDIDQIMVKAADLPELQGYLKLNLETVVRGTKKIVGYWAKKYLKAVPPIGHNDEGKDVLEETEGTTGGVLFQVKEHVLRLRGENFAHSDISVVTFNEHAANDIVEYLRDQNVKACLAEKWEEDHVTVDYNNNVLSQEYPAVIVVNYYGYLGASESTEFTALTRAIDRLIVIRKDRMIMQRKIDAIKQKPEYRGNVNIDMVGIVEQAAEILYNEEETAIKWTESLRSPTDWPDRLRAANDWDQWLAELRYNVMPIFPIENSHFTECMIFSDAFQVLIDNDDAMRDFLKTHVPVDHPFYSYDIALQRLKEFNYEEALDLNHTDVRDEHMRITLLRFRERYLESLEDYLKNTSEDNRKNNYVYRQDIPKWRAITRTVFTLG